MKIKFAALALLVSGAFCCSDSFANDLLGRMLTRNGCGCDAAPTCCDTPAACCGGRTLSINIHLPGRGFLSGLRGRGVGCGSYADAGCGCDAPIGGGCCDHGHGGGRLRGRLGGLFHRGGGGWDNGCCDTGCGNACDQGCAGAPVAAPVAAGCGCNGGAVANNCCDPCGSAGGLLSGLRGGRGCGNAWGGDCGCGAAPVAAGCGCNGGVANDCCGDPCGCGNGFLSGLRGRFGSRRGGCCGGNWDDCGCSAAPVAAGCGCNGGSFANDCCDPCGRGGRLGLLSRLRSGHGHGCCGVADNCCGSGHVHPVAAGCGCNGGAVPVQGAPMQAAPADAAPADAAPAQQGNGGVEVPPDAGTNRIKTPMVDPNSFIIRNTGYRN